ncbi:aldose epimerase family protein [Sphingobacterium sp. FBM7-1]|uniref:aldose epimerase family protein n=1 Tax=Sphingobacterium sp. FBM7-1 TaxID=2886688 RepID=UPI001D109A7A|nr:aldose epimerase family protein [Sphingobacterium sp. FBM7-1]MCC2599169.1 galactose mutarotase [Sphingobacterium sp. FBM7-1]
MVIYSLPRYQDFEHKIDGKKTHLFILRNRTGMQVAFTDYGARIVSILVPDKAGNLRDVLLGFNSIHDYLQADEQYHGATIGRFANRIAHGSFQLDGEKYTLQQNNGRNSLHGGATGFHTKVWDRRTSFKNKIDFCYISPDGEEGFPGNLKVTVTYELTENNEISIKYLAETDKKTVINLTNHAYFNLDGEGHGDVLDHILHIPADHFLPIDEHQIPIDQPVPVEGTLFDFRSPKRLSTDITKDDEQLRRGNGYDHTLVNNQPFSKIAASAFSPHSGIRLEVLTTEPGIQLYTGNFLSGKDIGKSGRPYPSRSAFCFETQHYPNSPNNPHFPSVVLEPGDRWESETIYRFCIKKEM